MVPDLSVENSFELVTSESEKLQQSIEAISKIHEKNIPDIISLYYQAVMVQTLAKKLKNDFESFDKSEHKKLLDKIDEIEKYLVDNFTKPLHPEILTQLTNSIQSSTENLKLLGKNSEQKTNETIEKEALLYKELRELMSTKEFVEQYEIGLKDD
jgi:phage gp36-like protein